MSDATPAILFASGPYRIIATDGDEPAGVAFGTRMPTYAVIDTAGTPLRVELSFDAAKAWLLARQQEAVPGEQLPPPQPAPRSRRRRR